MTPADAALGFAAGLVSCLTPEALLLFPLAFVAAAASPRGALLMLPVGLGLSLVLTGLAAGFFGDLFGFVGLSFRHVICLLLLAQGLVLFTGVFIERLGLLTGRAGSVFDPRGGTPTGRAFRLTLLALFIGANWFPVIGPTLGRASLLAADPRNSGAAMLVLFTFGFGAALPWAVAGRILRLLLRPFAPGVLQGMAGKRILGLALIAVAVLGATGQDAAMARRLNPMLPTWAHQLATSF